MEQKFAKAREYIISHNGRSAWMQGVTHYSLDLLEGLAEDVEDGYVNPESLATRHGIISALLNGASSWSQYSFGGCALIYDEDIAERLCTPSELKKTRNGERRPNSREEWLDVQARALSQAAARVATAIMEG